jgi:hypothetical protein
MKSSKSLMRLADTYVYEGIVFYRGFKIHQVNNSKNMAREVGTVSLYNLHLHLKYFAIASIQKWIKLIQKKGIETHFIAQEHH